MNTGKLSKRIKVIFKGVGTSTPLGGQTFAEGDPKDVWGNAVQLSMSEQLRNGLDVASASYRFYFRYQSIKDVSRIDSIEYKSKKFRIVSVENVNEGDDQIVLLANEQR